MIDTIKPMGMNLTKDLHGHVRVELRDRWTGRIVESQEKDNLVTDAAQKLVLSSGWMSGNDINSIYAPIYQKALGGILLFDGALTESIDNTRFPSSVKLVAVAGQDANSTEAIGGSYNAEESTPISNGFTTVWDFLTSQANGTIASLARTSHFASSYVPRYQISNFYLSPFLHSGLSAYMNSMWILGYDEANDYIYFALSSSQTIGGTTYATNTIYRASGSLYKLRVSDPFQTVAIWTAIKTLTSSDGSTNATNYIYDPYANNFVYRNGTTLHLVAIDGTHTTKTLSGAPAGTGIVATENYYCVNSSNTIYRFDKANPASAQTITATVGVSRVVPGDHDIVFGIGSASIGVDIIYPDGTKINKAVTETGSYTMSRAGMYYTDISTSYASRIYLPTLYLGTIANLDSPVTKTSSQTMKITYTLTEA